METSTIPLNPWFSMWFRPRDTISQITATNSTGAILLLAALNGFSQALDRASINGLGDQYDWPILIIICLIFGTFSGLLMLLVGAALLRWTGNWIGGAANREQLRTAIAWSSVPIIWALLLWIPILLLLGQQAFTSEMPILNQDPMRLYAFWSIAGLEVIIAIWSLVLFVKSISQVQKFSVWKAIVNIILALGVVAVPIVTIALIVAA